jgi:flagellar hook protein FlgE
MDPIATARYGMIAAAQRFEQSANRVAGMGAQSEIDLGQEVVEQISAKTQFQAQIGVVKAADEMWRALLDVQASN